MLKCPACSAVLFRRRLDAIELDGCPGCGGAWFDKGELNQLVRAPETLRKVDREFRPVQQAALPERSDHCPRCAQPLRRFEHPSLPGIEVDGCMACKGIWLDHGEPTAIADRLAPPAPEPPPEPVPFDPPIGLAPHLMPQGSGAGPRPSLHGVPDRAAAIRANQRDSTSTAGMPLVGGRARVQFDDGHGFVDRIGRAFRFLTHGFALAFQKPALLYPLLLGAAVNLAVIFVMVNWLIRRLQERSGDFELMLQSVNADMARWLQGNVGLLLGGIVLTLLLTHLINNAIMGMTINMIDAHLKGLEPRFSVAFRDVLKNLLAIIALAVVGTLVDVVVSLLRGNGRNNRSLVGVVFGGMLRALAAAIEAAWTVLHFLLLPVIMIEDVGLGRALERVRHIHRSSLLPIAVGELGLTALGGLLGFGLVALGGAIGWMAWPIAPVMLVRLTFLVIAASTLVGVAMSFLRGAYYTCLYLWAAEREVSGEQAVVPAPLADALAA